MSTELRRFLRPNDRWLTLGSESWNARSLAEVQANPAASPFCSPDVAPEIRCVRSGQWEKHKAELVEEIEQLEHELTGIDNRLKTTPSHLDRDKLPEGEKFQRLAPSRKQLVDTVKMIAYRAETALEV